MKFSERLKMLRKERGYTQDDIAALLGVSKQTISGYERGVRRPSFEYLDKLGDFFNVDLSFLLGNTDVRGCFPRHDTSFNVALSPDEMNMLYAFRSASKDTRAAVLRILEIH